MGDAVSALQYAFSRGRSALPEHRFLIKKTNFAIDCSGHNSEKLNERVHCLFGALLH